MPATRTPGITISSDGHLFIDKRYRGIRIGMRLGATNQEQAEQRLRTEMQQVDIDLAGPAYTRPTFADCAARYLQRRHNAFYPVSTGRSASISSIMKSKNAETRGVCRKSGRVRSRQIRANSGMGPNTRTSSGSASAMAVGSGAMPTPAFTE